MKDFIKALEIFMKYIDEEDYHFKYPFACDYEVLYVFGVSPDDVSKEDLAELEELGFDPNEDRDGFFSYKYGS